MRRLVSGDFWRWGLVQAENEAWERYFCVNTRGTAPSRELHHQPLPWLLVRRAVNALALTPRDVFVDFGAGPGRALLMAARSRLKRVLGVEWFAPLAQAARQNIEAARHRLRSPVKIIVADAARWDVPDDVTAAYLFNPFLGNAIGAVQARLRASLDRRPRPLRLVYAHAKDQPDLLASCSFLTLRRVVSAGVFKDFTLSIYESAQSHWHTSSP